MSKLSVFNAVSIDGYFTDANGDMSWAHRDDDEWNAFAGDNASGGAVLLFGRKTYEMMVKHWPTAGGKQDNPAVAEGMNRLRKVVFSRSLDKVEWANTEIVKSDIVQAVRELKQGKGPDLVILGSGTIVSQLSDARLVDQYQIVLTPIVLGAGRTMFESQKRRLDLELKNSRTFKNGNVVLWYEPRS